VIFHLVKSGDTLGAIAKRYGTTVGELRRLNGLNSNARLRIGQSLRCSIGSSRPAPATNKSLEQPTVKKATTVMAQAGKPVYHRIRSGDTLGSIAQRYGTTVVKLCELNAISRTTVLRLGRQIRCS
jgi:LysM repeat protein